MPCYTPPHAYHTHPDTPEDCDKCDFDELLRTNKVAKSAFDKLTDMLCRVLTVFNDNLGVETLPDDIQDWWKAHKKWDEERKR